MKILHLCNDFAGSAVHAELYRRLDEAGVEQVVYCPLRNEALNGKNAFQGKHTQIIYSPILKKIHRLLFHLKINTIVRDIEQKIDLSEISCIHATTLFSDGAVALQLKKRHQIPFIAAVRNTDINVFMKYMPHLWTLHREVIREAEKIVFITPNLQKKCTAHHTLRDITPLLHDKSLVIHNGLNEYWLNHQACTTANDAAVLYIGRFDNNKNVLRLIRAITELHKTIPNIHLDLVGGDGEQEQEVLRCVQQHPDLFTYHGKIYDKPLLQSIYLKNSIFAMASKKETFGLVYVEALSQGLRVLYTRNEGIDGLFPYPVGESVNPFSVGEMGQALTNLIQKPEAYQKPTPDELSEFDWAVIAKQYLAIYHTI